MTASKYYSKQLFHLRLKKVLFKETNILSRTKDLILCIFKQIRTKTLKNIAYYMLLT